MVKMDLKIKCDDVCKTNIAFAVVGAIMGYVSFSVSNAYGNQEISIVLLAIAIFATKIGLEKLANIKQPRNWWLSNGAVLAVLLWLVVWTIFFNIGMMP
jgi:hypothetical protein